MSFFENESIEEADSFERRDLTLHRDYMSRLVAKWRALPEGKVAVGEVTVMTGEPSEGKKKNRGKDELADERGFRQAASELGVGLKVTHRHIGEGKTILRLSPQTKKEFSDEAIAKRNASLERRRDRLAVEKYAKEHGKQVAHLTADEARAAIQAYRAEKAAADKEAATPIKRQTKAS